MKPKQLSHPNNFENSFQVRRDYFPKHHNSWHYHEQLELVFIKQGHGSLYLGDAIIDFAEGDCLLIGPNMPHFWLFHNLKDQNISNPIDCIVIHFSECFAGVDFFNLPELKKLKNIIHQAHKGIIIHNTKKLENIFNIVLHSNGTTKFLSLIKIIEWISDTPYLTIVSVNYSTLNNSNDDFRMRNVMNFIQENYLGKIELQKLANEAKMTKNSFCRYFKQRTGKSPSQFVNELRIAHACRLLKNTKMTLKEICYASGFNNFVSFYKTFKTQINKTPTDFRNH